MRELPQLDTDVLVLGHGATGLFASWELAKAGQDVTVLGTGTSATEMSTGCISFPEGDTWRKDLDLEDPLIREASGHIDVELEAWLNNGPYSMIGSSTTRRALLTNIGIPSNVNYAPRTSYRYDISYLKGVKVVALGVRGHRDLDPVLMSMMAKHEVGLEVRPMWTTRQNEGVGTAPVLMNNGDYLDREMLVTELKGMDADLVILPPLFDHQQHDKAFSDLSREVGRMLTEAVTPLSLPGVRLARSMEKATMSQGIRDLRGVKLLSLKKGSEGQIIATCRSGLRTLQVRSRSMLFCGGNLVGGGLDVRGLDIIDPLSFFDLRNLPSVDGSPVSKASRTGLACDHSFHAFHQGQRLDDVFVAGSALPGLSYNNGLGQGACLITALAACRSLREAQ